MPSVDYTALRPFCGSARQAEILEAVISTGSILRGAEALGVSRPTVQQTLRRIKKNAARRGFDPEHDLTHPAAPGNRFDQATTLYRMPEPGEDGGPVLQWVRQKADSREREAAIREFVDELAATVKPRKAIKAPRFTDDELMVGYPIGDHHFGMYATIGDAGGDYDLDKAKAVLAEAVDYLVASSPDAETAVLANLGDFTHTDNRTNATPRSGHVLDVSARYHDICRAAAFSLAHATNRLLEKHKRVKIVNCPGNHDQDTAGWLSLFMQAWFRNEPRVEVDSSPGDWLFHQFGRNMICMTHGHKSKLDAIPGVMATLAPEMWGDTSYRVAWTGHMHHAERRDAKESRGALVEQFGVLAPADNYSHNLGYRAQQEMHSITFRKSGGILCRATYNAGLQ